jgi:Ribonuclease G/E
MNNEELEEVLAGERKFLHDIANHIVVAQGMGAIVLRSIKNNSYVDAKEVERLEKSIAAINKMTELLNDRRTVLHSKT